VYVIHLVLFTKVSPNLFVSEHAYMLSNSKEYISCQMYFVRLIAAVAWL